MFGKPRQALQGGSALDEKRWSAVEEYLVATLVKSDAVLDKALADSDRGGLPAINVSPCQGKLLNLIARMISARRILEIGTLGGYSTIWLARALPPSGRLITLEFLQKHADIARANVERAGLQDRVDIRVGRALDTLPAIAEESREPFDLVFIDADKESNRDYLGWAIKLSRPGTVIITDNVVRNGRVIDAENRDPTVVGTRRFLEALSNEPRLSATAIQTVGSKGWDGFTLAIVD
jgi:predicted O-methyltransferase YrrM